MMVIQCSLNGIKFMNINELTAAEKILLAEELWDSVAIDAELLPLTEDQKSELDAR